MRQNLKLGSHAAHLFDIPPDDKIHLEVGALLVQLTQDYTWQSINQTTYSSVSIVICLRNLSFGYM